MGGQRDEVCLDPTPRHIIITKKAQDEGGGNEPKRCPDLVAVGVVVDFAENVGAKPASQATPPSASARTLNIKQAHLKSLPQSNH
jgi:hypothetical protein